MPAVVKVTESGSGSGFFMSRDTLLTNAHVGQQAVNLILSNGERRTAQVETTYDTVDMAVLKARVVDYDQVFLALGAPADVRIGSLADDAEQQLHSCERAVGGARVVRARGAGVGLMRREPICQSFRDFFPMRAAAR